MSRANLPSIPRTVSHRHSRRNGINQHDIFQRLLKLEDYNYVLQKLTAKITDYN